MKNRTILKLAAFLLLAAMLLPACAQDKGGDKDASTTPAVTNPAETTPAETTADPNLRANHADKLPADLDFGGEAVTMLFRGTDSYLEGTSGSYWIINDVCGTDNIGDIVSDLVWERNQNVAERLHIDLSWVPTNGGGLGADQTMVRQTLTAATGEYDGMLLTGNTSATLGISAMLRGLENAPYIDYESPWWWNDVIECYSLDAKHYQFILGDMLMTNLAQTGVLFYNKNLYEDIYGDPDDMYKLAIDGDLTWDKVAEKVEGAYKDVNGDGARNLGDVFGYGWSVNKNEELSHIAISCGLDLYQRDEEGHLTITMDNERTVTAIETIYRLMNENEGSFSFGGGSIADVAKPFSESQMLFSVMRLIMATGETLREMEDDYGILPVPKLTEDQEYLSFIHDSGTVLCVPRTISDKKFETIGATFEALCGEAHRTYMDAFLDTALKMKYSRDALSGQCIDIFLDSLVSNPLQIYAEWTNSIVSSCIWGPMKSNPNGFASAFKKVGPAAQKTWDRAVEKLIEQMDS